MQKRTINIKGMHCISCEELISDCLNEIDGVKAKVSFANSNAIVSFDEKKVTLKDIEKAITNKGYKVLKDNKVESNNETKSSVDLSYIMKIIVIVFGLNYIILHFTRINILGGIVKTLNVLVSNVPVIDENTSLALLFIIGLLTSFHCVAMCGGINVTQCMTFKGQGKFSPNLMYNLGRVTSYTILGGIVGAIGSVFTLSVKVQAILYVFIGFFMVLMGLNLFGVNIGRKILPKMPKSFRNINKKGNGPYIVGLLNGLMPCGPLQSMQLYALSTGSFKDGAIAMFLFSVGTVPLMYLFGKIGDFKNPKIAQNFMKISAVLVLVLGIAMANRGISLLGLGASSGSVSGLTASIENGEQIIYTELEPRSYPDLVVQKGVKVKWVINVSQNNLNGCNNEIIINEYGIKQRLVVGENIIEFLPTESGNFKYSCWMGMIRANITVTE